MTKRGFFDRERKHSTNPELATTDDLARRQLLGLIGQQTDSEAALQDILAFHTDVNDYSNKPFSDFASLAKLLTKYKQLLGRINVLGVAIVGGTSDRTVDILYMSQQFGTSEAELEQLLEGDETLRDNPTPGGEVFALQSDRLTATLHRLKAAVDVTNPAIVFLGLTSGFDTQHAYTLMGQNAVSSGLIQGFHRKARAHEVNRKLLATDAMGNIANALLEKRNDIDFFLMGPAQPSFQSTETARDSLPLLQQFMSELKAGWNLKEVYVHILEEHHAVGVLVALGENADVFGELLTAAPLGKPKEKTSWGLAVTETDTNKSLKQKVQSALDPQTDFAVKTFDLREHRNWGAVTYVWASGEQEVDELFLRHFTTKFASLLECNLSTAELQRDSHIDRSTSYPNENAMRGALERMKEDEQTGCLVLLELRDATSYAENYQPEVIAQLERTILDRLREKLDSAKGINGLISRSTLYVILAEDPNSDTHLDWQTVVDELMEAISLPQQVDHHIIQPAAAAGYVLLGSDFNPARSVQECYSALAEASRVGSGTSREASRERLIDRQTRFGYEREIEAAVAEQQFEPFFQPEVLLSTGEILSFEALVRWIHPRLGLVSPDLFIPVAEDKDLIVRIDLQMLEAGIRKFVEWGFGHSGPMLRVNFSSTTLHHSGLAERVVEMYATLGLNPSQLCVEVTETSVMRDERLSMECLDAIRAEGIQISLDDFGQGTSSLSRLRSLPITEIKIDRWFVQPLPGDHADRAFLQSIVSIADAFDFEITAEGVETDEQRRTLIDLGFTKGQGYLFGRPLPADRIPQMLSNSQTQGWS
ncbi:MAG: EAL domain-containing protein [Actinobacteria bacterium]|nr:EAL domain-containing protein [Actinomycetota bacterium]